MDTNKLIELVNAEFCVDLSKNTRERKVVDARKVYAKILRCYGWSLGRIGKSIRKHHSTIIHYLKDVEWLLEHDSFIREKFLVILERYEHREVDPIYSASPEQNLATILALREENKFLLSAIKELDAKLKKEGRYKEIFTSILERVPSDKVDEFETKVTRILNGI